jgi:hypothetical protein
MGYSGQGTILPATGSYTYNLGASTIISANPASGYQFSYWLYQDNTKSYVASTSLVMSQSRSALAVFTLIPQPTLTPDPSASPTVTPAPTPEPSPLPPSTPQPTISPTTEPEPTPIPIEPTPEPTVGPSVPYIEANEFCLVTGLTSVVLSLMGAVLANPNWFGRSRW